MIKFQGMAIGLAAVLGASSANAATIYDTITGYTSTGAFKVGVTTGTTLTHDPMGDEFSVAAPSSITSVTLGLADTVATGPVTDAGSLLVYLVPDSGGLPSTSSGASLSPRTLLGSIKDTQLASGGVITDITLDGFSPVSLGAGDYWLELTSGTDPNNGGTNATQTTGSWAYFADSSLTSPGIGSISSFVIGGVPPIQTSNGPNLDTGFENVFEAQISAIPTVPEPASLALLGAGLTGLGVLRRRRVAKLSSD